MIFETVLGPFSLLLMDHEVFANSPLVILYGRRDPWLRSGFEENYGNPCSSTRTTFSPMIFLISGSEKPS